MSLHKLFSGLIIYIKILFSHILSGYSMHKFVIIIMLVTNWYFALFNPIKLLFNETNNHFIFPSMVNLLTKVSFLNEILILKVANCIMKCSCYLIFKSQQGLITKTEAKFFVKCFTLIVITNIFFSINFQKPILFRKIFAINIIYSPDVA